MHFSCNLCSDIIGSIHLGICRGRTTRSVVGVQKGAAPVRTCSWVILWFTMFYHAIPVSSCCLKINWNVWHKHELCRVVRLAFHIQVQACLCPLCLPDPEAMGITGVEGIYRQCCEVTMEVRGLMVDFEQNSAGPPLEERQVLLTQVQRNRFNRFRPRVKQ